MDREAFTIDARAHAGKPLLSISNVTKRFGGIVALNNVSFDVRQGEIVGLIGPNGAGKTTCLSIIAGFLRPDQGKVYFKNRDITKLAPFKRARLGLIGTFQIPRPFRNLTVYQNLLIGAYYSRRREKEADIERILQITGLSEMKNVTAGKLTLINLKKLELARAWATRPLLLLLDEIGAGLDVTQIPQLIEVLKEMTKEGITLVMVEHIMEVIMRISQRVIVLCEGKKIAEGSPRDISKSKKVIESYLGFMKF